MALRQSTQSFIDSLPQTERDMATAIFERTPQGYHAALRDIITRLNSGGHLRDGLIHLDSITSSERFNPAYLGTVSLIIQRSGDNHISALSEYSRIVNNDRFNRHVDETVRLTVLRTGEHSHESLSALYFLFSNPNFQQQDLTITFPGRFLTFIDAAKRNSPDFEHMAYRALGHMFANSQFTPAMLTAQFATRFGQMVREVRDRSGAMRLDAMESFACVLGNSAIRPDEMTVELAGRIADLSRQAIESAAPRSRLGSPAISPQQNCRRLNLILGDRRFRLDMVSESGLLTTYLSSSGSTPVGLETFHEFLRNARRNEHAVGAVELMVRGGMRSQEAVTLVNAVLRNEALAPRLGDERFVQSLIETRNLLFRGFHLNYTNLLTSQVDLLAGLLSHPQMSAETYDRMSAMLSSLRENSDVALLFLSRYFTGGSFRGAGEQFFSDLGRVVNDCVSKGVDPTNLAVIFISDFDPSYIRPDGIISQILSQDNPERISGMLHGINLIQQKRALSRCEPLIREILRIGGTGAVDSINSLGNIAIGGFTQAQADAVLRLITASGARHPLALRIYHEMQGNASLSGVMLLDTYIDRVAALVRRFPSARASETATLVGQIMHNPSFNPRSLAVLESIAAQAGPSAHFVFEFIFTIQNARKTDLSQAMTPEFIQFISRAANIIHRYAGPGEAQVHAAFSSLLVEMREGRRVGSAFDLMGRSEEILEFLRGIGSSSGQMAPFAMRSVIGALRQMRLSQYDAQALGARLGTYFSSLPADQRESAIGSVSSMFAAMTVRPRLREIFLDEPELYAQGKALAESLITDRPVGPDVILNFAYAIDEIGLERTRGIHQAFGIRYFARYSNDVLERLYESRARAADPSRPSALVVFPFSDWNGAFYQSGDRLDDLLDSHNVIIYERGSEEGFYSAGENFRSRYGRTGTLVVGGHGNPQGITFGLAREGQDQDEVQLDLTDRTEMRRLRNVLNDDPRIILVSCSTGKNGRAIGGIMSDELHATLYAPRVPSNVDEFVVDDRGRVAAVYTDEGSSGIFYQGQDVLEEEERRSRRKKGT